MLDLLKNGQGEILNLMFQNPEQEFYLSEISKMLGKTRGHYKKSFDFLVDSGILKEERKGPLRYFRLNKEHFLYSEIKAIISKTIGLEFQLREMIGSFDEIDYAFIYGSVAKEDETSGSDIDLVVISDSLDSDKFFDSKLSYQKILNKEISCRVYKKKEFLEKINNQNSFILNILANKKIILKGNINDFSIRR